MIMNDIAEFEDYNVSFANKLKNACEKNVLELISNVVKDNEIREILKQCIDKKAIYIAKIPENLEKDFDLGNLKFLTEKKTGKSLGTIVNEKNKIKGQVRIEKYFNTPDISLRLSSLIIQQQLSEITNVINDVRSRIITLQKRQDRNLYGRIHGMYHQMIQINVENKSEKRNQLINNTISSLNETRGIIEVEIVDLLKTMEYVPDKNFKIILKILKNKDFLSQTIDAYDRIEELVCYYLQATQLLGYAYAFLNEKQSFESVFTPFSELTDKKILKKLKSVEKLYNEDLSASWYNNPNKYMLSIKKEAQRLFTTEEDRVVEIEIYGENLLGVFEDGYAD